MTFNHAEALYSLNGLIADLRAWGWEDKAKELESTRDDVWADAEDSTEHRIFIGLTYLPAHVDIEPEGRWDRK